MAKIKSSIELAMEKTASYKLSVEEKEKIQEEEIRSKAMGFVNRFLEAGLHFREVEKELSKYESDQRTQLERFMISDFAKAIQLDRDNALIFEGIEKLKPGSRKLIGSIQDLVASYQKRKEQKFEKIAMDIRSRLEKSGISGSAVVPKVMGSPEWEKVQASFKPAFEKRLDDFLAQLKD